MPKNDYLAQKTPRVGKRVKKFLTSSHDARPKEKIFFENCDLKSQIFDFKSQNCDFKSQNCDFKSQICDFKSQKL